MTNIVLQGICGRMGRVLIDMIGQRQDCRVVAGVDNAACEGMPCPVVDAPEGLAALAQKPDVVIDFSLPQATDKLLDYCAANGLPCVICTTGLSDDIKAKMKDASAKTAVFFSGNMSLGINLLSHLVKKAQAVLEGFDIEIVEKHHHTKVDAPSGTALMLADAANEAAGGRYHYVYDRHAVRQQRDPDELGIHSVRGGSIVGEHEVIFAGPDEVVSLSHIAYSRKVFASGAVAAALYLAGKGPGLYDMDDMLEGR